MLAECRNHRCSSLWDVKLIWKLLWFTFVPEHLRGGCGTVWNVPFESQGNIYTNTDHHGHMSRTVCSQRIKLSKSSKFVIITCAFYNVYFEGITSMVIVKYSSKGFINWLYILPLTSMSLMHPESMYSIFQNFYGVKKQNYSFWQRCFKVSYLEVQITATKPNYTVHVKK